MGSQFDWKVKKVSKDGSVYQTVGAAIYCGKEIELNLPISESQATDIINTIVTYCKTKNATLRPNKKMNQIISIPVMFKVMLPITGENESVLRMAIADENGRFPEDAECSPLFRKQHEVSRRLS